MNEVSQAPTGADTTVLPRPTWDAKSAFAEAIDAAKEAKSHENDEQSSAQKRREAIWRSLQLTLRLFEHAKQDHGDEVNRYLAECGTKPKKTGDDEMLVAIAKCVFTGETAQARTWRLNALRQVIAAERTSEDVITYFEEVKPPTAAARQWVKDHPDPGKATTVTYFTSLSDIPALKFPDKKDAITIRREKCDRGEDCIDGHRIVVPNSVIPPDALAALAKQPGPKAEAKLGKAGT